MRNRRPTIRFMWPDVLLRLGDQFRLAVPAVGVHHWRMAIRSLAFASEVGTCRLRDGRLCSWSLAPCSCKRTNGTDMAAGWRCCREGEFFEANRGCSSSAASANRMRERDSANGGWPLRHRLWRTRWCGRVRADAVPGAPDTRQGAECHNP